jgi:hypothetical protein
LPLQQLPCSTTLAKVVATMAMVVMAATAAVVRGAWRGTAAPWRRWSRL